MRTISRATWCVLLLLLLGCGDDDGSGGRAPLNPKPDHLYLSVNNDWRDAVAAFLSE